MLRISCAGEFFFISTIPSTSVLKVATANSGGYVVFLRGVISGVGLLLAATLLDFKLDPALLSDSNKEAKELFAADGSGYMGTPVSGEKWVRSVSKENYLPCIFFIIKHFSYLILDTNT